MPSLQNLYVLYPSLYTSMVHFNYSEITGKENTDGVHHVV